MLKAEHIGFTGSRHGVTWPQHSTLRKTLWAMKTSWFPGEDIWLHHGGCVGADEYAHRLAKEFGYKIHLHPPLNKDKYFTLEGQCDLIDKPFSYSGRNQRIAAASNILLATPRTGSVGTWNCINHMRNLKRPVLIIDALTGEIKENTQ